METDFQDLLVVANKGHVKKAWGNAYSTVHAPSDVIQTYSAQRKSQR